jgi:hypothetical protein
MTEEKQSNDRPVEQMKPDERSANLLSTSLSVAVPLRIHDMLQNGGPSDRDLARVRSYQSDLMERGADLFFLKAGATAERFNQVADALAVLSFSPGGITLFGQHYDSREVQAQQEMMRANAEQTERE